MLCIVGQNFREDVDRSYIEDVLQETAVASSPEVVMAGSHAFLSVCFVAMMVELN